MELVVSSAVSQLSNFTLATNITHNILSKTIQKSFQLLKKFVSSHHDQINEILIENDLVSKLEIIQALMNDIEKQINDFEKESIHKALFNLHSIVEEISNTLLKIDNKIKYHQTKYFYKWRTLNYENELQRLKRDIKLLDLRYQMFLEVLKVR
jgi:hypothetical protein